MHSTIVFATVMDRQYAVAGFVLSLILIMAVRADAIEYLSGIRWSEPERIDPGSTNAAPPSDAVVLFDGTNLSAWVNGEKWIVEGGVATVGKQDIQTRQEFGDCQLHIEWSAPVPAEGDGQKRGNSGVFFGDYEMQVLDSYENKTYFDGQAGAIYKQTPPMVNAMRPPGEWNTYDILWTAPRFHDDGTRPPPPAQWRTSGDCFRVCCGRRGRLAARRARWLGSSS